MSSHGATMGNLDEEEIYYLRSRGIGEIEARKMVIGHDMRPESGQILDILR